MKVIGVIPARWASTRFPGKVLADINGTPMIQHVWEQARKSKRLKQILIACDDKRILAAVKKFGGEVVTTSPDHTSGSDRIAQAVKNLKVDIIVNIQADEPLIHPSVIDSVADCLLKDKAPVMATVIKTIDNDHEIHDPNCVKVVIDKNKYALYFSRSAIPFNREQKKIQYYKHLGIYAYRKDFLLKFTRLAPTRLEKIEKLEQLRVLEAGYKIKTVETDRETIGVDTAADLAKVLKIINH